MKIVTKAIITALATFSISAHAAIGEHPIILIHGFQADQLQTKPDRQAVEQEGADYWRDFWLAKADDRIDWPSQERVAGKISSDYIWPKLQELAKNQTCSMAVFSLPIQQVILLHGICWIIRRTG